MNEIEELYENILDGDFDYSHLDKLMSLVEKNTIDKVHTWLADNLPNQIGFVDANVVIQKFFKDIKS